MVEQPIEVDVQIAGRDVPAGRLWTHRHGQSESATFRRCSVHIVLSATPAWSSTTAAPAPTSSCGSATTRIIASGC